MSDSFDMPDKQICIQHIGTNSINRKAMLEVSQDDLPRLKEHFENYEELRRRLKMIDNAGEIVSKKEKELKDYLEHKVLFRHNWNSLATVYEIEVMEVSPKGLVKIKYAQTGNVEWFTVQKALEAEILDDLGSMPVGSTDYRACPGDTKDKEEPKDAEKD